ncbi:MAG: 6-carboxytetrahydropterin synthase QueD [Planctomycetaceae bacterium]|jgi:6-pyruvoyltetrahydropterin/6-carboxytetrahydropterin synthase|nr:6-carboxytetrahydropterin synthase QueD [Planctomycetaceae bacterium]
MFAVTCEFHFCYGHRLLNYDGKCAHLHGHNGLVEITLEKESLDEKGMVLDFSELKQVVNAWIDKNIDHKMVLDENDPLASMLAELNEPMYLMKRPPTAENFARLFFEYVKESGYPVSRVVFHETEKCSATYSCDTKNCTSCE